MAGALTYTAGAGISNGLTISTAAGSYTINDTGETITLGAGATGAGWTGSGTNTVTGLTTTVTAGIAVSLLTGSDTLTVVGTPGVFDNLRHIPTNAGAGQIVNDAGSTPATITFTGVELIVLLLQFADGDGARVDGTIGNDAFQFFHEATPGSGRVVGTMDQNNATGVGPFALTSTIFAGTNPAANDFDVNFFAAGGVDTFQFNGTTAADVITIGNGEAGGTELRNTISAVLWSRVELFNMASADALGDTGNDTFNVTPRATLTINVFGGLPIPPALPGDRLIVDTSGATNTAIVLNLTPTGFSGGYTFGNRAPVTFSQIEGGEPGGDDTNSE